MTDGRQFHWRKKRVTVMGLGRFGGGVGVVRFLVSRGARVTVTDLQGQQALSEPLGELQTTPPAELHLGGHREQDFIETDVVVVNPAVPRDNRFLELARRHGVPLTSEMTLFWQYNRGRVIGITGSNGKSTTAALIHAILQAAGKRCWLGGNIGKSLLPEVGDIQRDDWVVLELSSFQLEDLNRLTSSPEVAVVTNFRPNHLDRHGTLAAYRQAKQTILRWQTSEQTAILNADDPDVNSWPTTARCYRFGNVQMHQGDICRDGLYHDRTSGQVRARLDDRDYVLPLHDWLSLPGRHNVQNALAAVCTTLAIGVEREAVEQGLRTFQPLPHRLQFVAEVNGRRFYNDSLATTPESVEAALDAFAEPIVLLAGGSDKGVNLRGMAQAIAKNSKAVALMGETANLLATLLAEREGEAPAEPPWSFSDVGGCSGAPRLHSRARGLATIEPHHPPATKVCRAFDEAFQWAVEQTQPGDIVLLSPGCASYDWFSNFAERGRQFAKHFAKLQIQ